LIKLFTDWLLAAAQAEHELRRPATSGTTSAANSGT
jgi:hypothetical protein